MITNKERAFEKGDVISYADQWFVVIENYGRNGKVHEYGHPEETISTFYWEIYGEEAVLVPETLVKKHQKESVLKI